MVWGIAQMKNGVSILGWFVLLQTLTRQQYAALLSQNQFKLHCAALQKLAKIKLGLKFYPVSMSLLYMGKPSVKQPRAKKFPFVLFQPGLSEWAEALESRERSGERHEWEGVLLSARSWHGQEWHRGVWRGLCPADTFQLSQECIWKIHPLSQRERLMPQINKMWMCFHDSAWDA